MSDDLQFKGVKYHTSPSGLIPIPDTIVVEHAFDSSDDVDLTLASDIFKKNDSSPKMIYVTGFSFFLKDGTSVVNYTEFGESSTDGSHQLEVLLGDNITYSSKPVLINADYFHAFDTVIFDTDENEADIDKETLLKGSSDLRKSGVSFPKIFNDDGIIRLVNGLAGLGNKGLTWKINIISFYKTNEIISS